MKQSQKSKAAKKFEFKGRRIRVNKSLDKYSGKDLCPQKTAKINELFKGVKLPE